MNALIHSTVGRTAIRILLVAVVLTAGIAGTVGTTAAEPMDGKGDDPYPPSLYASLDGKGNDLVTAGLSVSDIAPEFTVTENDIGIYAFPINNVTLSIGGGGGSGKPSF